MITKYGYSTVAKVGAISLLLMVLAIVLPLVLGAVCATAGLLLMVFTLQFFRDPERTPPKKERIILSPADGKIVRIEETEHPFFQGKAKMVSIFMSPLNVHVNRNPISGKITHLKHMKANTSPLLSTHRASATNERKSALKTPK
jgi:Phosphatidylserine decarboxylase